MAGLVGYKRHDRNGLIVCVDCDVYPPDSTYIYRGDKDADLCCGLCGQALREVMPVGAGRDE